MNKQTRWVVTLVTTNNSNNNNNNNNKNKNNNSEAEHYIKRNPHAKNNSKDLLLKVMVVLNIFLDLLNLQLDISKNDLRMLQRDFFVKVTAISI